MLLTETHCHTAEISLCAKVPANEIPALYKEKGYGAIVVTDHYNCWTLDALGDCRMRQIERWLEGWRLVRQAGEALGMRVFLGMELALTQGPEDFLIYGVSEGFLFRYPGLVDGTLEEAFRIISGEGLLLYQAHPCRSHITCAPAKLLHGVEVFNGSQGHDSHNDRAEAFARLNHLKMIAGSDFHQVESVGRGGIWVPEGVENNQCLLSFLKEDRVDLYTPSTIG